MFFVARAVLVKAGSVTLSHAGTRPARSVPEKEQARRAEKDSGNRGRRTGVKRVQRLGDEQGSRFHRFPNGRSKIYGPWRRRREMKGNWLEQAKAVVKRVMEQGETVVRFASHGQQPAITMAYRNKRENKVLLPCAGFLPPEWGQLQVGDLLEVGLRIRRCFPFTLFYILDRFRGRNPSLRLDVVYGRLHPLRVLLGEQPQVLRTDLDFRANALIQHRRTPRHARRPISAMVAGGGSAVHSVFLFGAYSARQSLSENEIEWLRESCCRSQEMCWQLLKSRLPDLNATLYRNFKGLRCSRYSRSPCACIASTVRPAGFMTRILIADDRELMRVALRVLFLLRPNWKICGKAEDGRAAVAKATELKPDVIVLDFKMPLADGLEAASEICRTMPTTPIVMYTLYKSVQLEAAARLVGVRRVVAKEDGVEGLLHAIEAELVAKKYQRRSDQV